MAVCVVYVVTVLLGVYIVVQGYALEGIVVLGLAATGLPLMIGLLRTELRRFASRDTGAS